MEKNYQNKDWLYEQYHIKGLTQKEIGKLCGVSKYVIGRRTRKFKIKKTLELYQNKDWLIDQYINKEKRINVIAEETKKSLSTIFYWIDKFGIIDSPHRRVSETRGNSCNITNEFEEWLNGELLGDGCLRKTSNYSASIQYTSKYKEYINYVSSTLNSFGINQGGSIYHRHYSKGFIIVGIPILKDAEYYQYRSLCYVELLPFCKRWYPKGKKIVPKDIELTPLTCRQWYIGDGSLSHPKGKRNPYIYLHTKGFIISDVEWLVIQLNKLGFKSSRQPSCNIIHISTYSVKDFLNYIGPCPVGCYQYKWNY